MNSSWSGRLALLRLEDRTVPATIAGIVYADVDGDGLFGAGDTPISSSTIELRNSGGMVINSATTGPAGTYSFSTDNTIVVSPATLQQTATVPLTATDFSTTVNIPQFDPSLGTLTGVTIRLDGSVRADFQFETLDASPAGVSGTLQTQLNLNRPDTSLLVSALPTATTADSVGDFDGVLDFGGGSGRTYVGLLGNDSASTNLGASDLFLFTGTGTLALPFTGTDTSTASGSANLATVISTSAAATVTVTYAYLPSNAIRGGNYTVVQTAQPAGFLDGPESQGGAVIPGSVGTDTIPVTVAAVTDVFPDNNFGEVAPNPVIRVVKLTNGTDNDAAPGVFVPVGSTVTFTYVVTNTGNVPLNGVTVEDDNGTPAFVSDDFNATFVSGDANANNLLDPTEAWTYTASRIATPGQHTNVATATGTATVGGATVTATNPDNHFGAISAIVLVKLTNGTDNNAAPGPTVPIGSVVTFTYVVTNPGNVPLSGVFVEDDNGTVADPADDFNAAFVGGDTNTNGLLDTNETWTFTASRVATAGQYTNVATAHGIPPGAGPSVEASDPDNHLGAGAAVRLVALTNARDNNAAPGPIVTVGKTVVFVYLTYNLGDGPLAGVTVTDDAGTPTNPADDITAAFAGGDENGNGLLDLGESWVFTATRIATPGQYTNVATVTALPELGGAPVTAADGDNHFGFVPVIAAGAGPGGSPQVKRYNVDGSVSSTIQAFDPSFLGGVRVAVGDVTGDGVNDVIAGAGPGAGAHVKVFDGVTNAEVRSFFAFAGFTGGVFVGAGDIDGDGRADVIVGAGAGGAPHVKVFSGATGAELRSFFAFAPDFSGGVTVAGGDITGDRRADVVVGSGTGSHVKVFDGATGAEERSFFAFAGFAGGVFVGSGDLDCDGRDEIVVGAGPGGAPHVQVFDGASNAVVRSFFAFGLGFTGGVRVAAGEVNAEGMADLILGAGTGSEVKALDGMTSAEFFDVIAFGPATRGVFVG